MDEQKPDVEITDVEELKDIEDVVENHTGDGPGSEDPGEGDFVGYEDPDVMEEGL